MSTLIDPGIGAALAAGYRIAVHRSFFPYESHDPKNPGTVHAVVDHGAQAIFCSQEWFESMRKAIA